MERYEMAELLSKKAGVSLEEAKTALEENNWDLLDAMVALERAHKTAGTGPSVHMETEAAPSYTSPIKPVKNVSGKTKREPFFTNGFATLWEYIKKLFRISLDNDFVVIRKDKQLLAVPVLVMVVLLFASFGLMLVVLIAGLFCGCQYRFEGRQLGRDSINDAMGKASDIAEDIKESFRGDGQDGPQE